MIVQRPGPFLCSSPGAVGGGTRLRGGGAIDLVGSAGVLLLARAAPIG